MDEDNLIIVGIFAFGFLIGLGVANTYVPDLSEELVALKWVIYLLFGLVFGALISLGYKGFKAFFE